MTTEDMDSFEVYRSVACFTLFSELFVKEEEKIPEIVEVPHHHVQPLPKIKRRGRPKASTNAEKQKTDEIGMDKQKGHWSREERKKYHLFLEIYHEHFIKREMRRVDKIFKIMSSFIQTREAQQCRSHHQKMQKKHETFPNILLFLRNLHYEFDPEQGIMLDLRQIQTECRQILTQTQLLRLKNQGEKPIPDQCVEMEDGNAFISFQGLLKNSQDNELSLQFI